MAEQWKPLIIAASFYPNPAIVGEPVTARVLVIDAQFGEQLHVWYSGEILSGEV